MHLSCLSWGLLASDSNGSRKMWKLTEPILSRIIIFLKINLFKKSPATRHAWYFSFSSFAAAHQPHGLDELEEALPICKSSAKARAAVMGDWLPAAQRTYQPCRKAVTVPLSLLDNMTLCNKSWGILVRIALRSCFALVMLKIPVQNWWRFKPETMKNKLLEGSKRWVWTYLMCLSEPQSLSSSLFPLAVLSSPSVKDTRSLYLVWNSCLSHQVLSCSCFLTSMASEVWGFTTFLHVI